jgi:hypothetical protein
MGWSLRPCARAKHLAGRYITHSKFKRAHSIYGSIMNRARLSECVKELAGSTFIEERPSSGKPIGLIVAVGVFSIIPIVLYNHIPLGDYPNHLGRLQIHKSLSLGDLYLSRFFEFHWALVPNLALDLLTAPFLRFLPVELAGRLAIIICFLMTYGGTVLLDQELNRDSWGLSLFSGVFLYNGAFKFGFINYTIGIGFAICAFWIWVRYRDKARGFWVISFFLSAALVFFMHFFSFAIYAVCVAGYECSWLWEKLRTERRFALLLLRIPIIATATLIVPCLLLLVSSTSGSSGWIRGYKPSWGWLLLKSEGLAAPIYYSDPAVEIPLLITIAALFSWTLITQAIVANSRMLVPLGAFCFIFMAMPSAFSGSAYFADFRLPSGVASIVLASFCWGRAPQARKKFFQLLLSVCLVVRIASVISQWQPAQAIIEEYDRALGLVPPGSRLLVYMVPTPLGDRNPPLRHVPVFAAAMHDVFDPDTFTNGREPNGPQLLNLKSHYRDYWVDAPPDPSRISEIGRYDYLLEVRHSPANIPAGITLREVKRGQTYTLYQIRRQELPSEEQK